LKFRDNLKAVTAEDIMQVAEQYFVKEHRTVATLIPKASAGEDK